VICLRELSLIPIAPFFPIFDLSFEFFRTTILSGQKSPEHMVEKISFGTVILRDDMFLA